MSSAGDSGEDAGLVRRMSELTTEKGWIEFKENFADPHGIGEYISALSNSAALEGTSTGYMVWGIADKSHDVVGTKFDPWRAKVGNEDLVPWLTRLLKPQVHIDFSECVVGGKRVVLLRVAAAQQETTKFSGEEFVRLGSYKKKLKDLPDHERRLWRSFDDRNFETLTAKSHVTVDEITSLLDYPAFFRLSRTPLPENRSEIIEHLEGAGLVRYTIEDEWAITNLGALLLAQDFADFPHLERKAPRVIQYKGSSRVSALREQGGTRGYASGFNGMLDYIMTLLPAGEEIEGALREDQSAYPRLALRELLANMLVHQDLSVSGSSPMVELFDDRIEITNPGVPLIDKSRFLDHAPISRNEQLARSMRLMRICEERGSGWDKIAFEIEINQLPAPLIETTDISTRVTVFGRAAYKSLSREARLRAVYLHACLNHVQGKQTTNASVRARFGADQGQTASVSRLIKEAVDSGLLAPYDTAVGKRAMRYVPFWAASDS